MYTEFLVHKKGVEGMGAIFKSCLLKDTACVLLGVDTVLRDSYDQ